MPGRLSAALRPLVVALAALLATASTAQAVFVTLPNPVSLQIESIDLLRNSSPVDGDEW